EPAAARPRSWELLPYPPVAQLLRPKLSPRSSRSRPSVFLDPLDHADHVFDRSSRDDAVSQIEDVTWPAVGREQYLAHPLLEHPLGREQRNRVQISLHPAALADGL